MANINFQKETKFSRLLNKHEIRRHDFLANGGFKQWPNSGFAWTWTLFRRPFAFDFSPVLLAIQTRINDNRRYSVRYKVSRVCHAIVSLIVYNGRKNRPLLFPLFFSLFLCFLSYQTLCREITRATFKLLATTACVLHECFSLHTVYTEQCCPDNWIRVPARVRDNIRVNENVHAPMYVRIWRWSPVTHQRPELYDATRSS